MSNPVIYIDQWFRP